ncbi:MAG: hypothetical protein WC227_02440 [Patescibacteria group bacterium]|jgi:hypothetical protein
MSNKKYSYNALITILLITITITLANAAPVNAGESGGGRIILTEMTRSAENYSKATKKQYKDDLKSANAGYRSSVRAANSTYNSILKSTTDKNVRKQAKAAREKAIDDAQSKFDQAKKDALAKTI